MCTQAECEAAYDGICPYCTDANIARSNGVEESEVGLNGCADQVLCQLDDPCDMVDFLTSYFYDPPGPDSNAPSFPVTGIEVMGDTIIGTAGCFSCASPAVCPTECPMGGGDDAGSTLPSSIVAPGCGTIVAVDCPLISTAI